MENIVDIFNQADIGNEMYWKYQKIGQGDVKVMSKSMRTVRIQRNVRKVSGFKPLNSVF